MRGFSKTKKGGAFGAALTTENFPIASELPAKDSVAYDSRIVKEALLTLKRLIASFYVRPGRESNPDHLRRQQRALSVKLPGLIFHTGYPPKKFPSLWRFS